VSQPAKREKDAPFFSQIGPGIAPQSGDFKFVNAVCTRAEKDLDSSCAKSPACVYASSVNYLSLSFGEHSRVRWIVLLSSLFWVGLLFGGVLGSSERQEVDLAVNRNLILAHPVPTGEGVAFTYTLASRLGQALAKAEALFGQRDERYTILGIEFTSNSHPQIWYPGGSGKRSYVIIQLTSQAAKDQSLAAYQLFHEVIHLLSPVRDHAVTALEEGLATYYSLTYPKILGLPTYWGGIADSRYEIAYQDVKQLLECEPEAIAKIKALRHRYSSFSSIPYRALRIHFPSMPQDVLERLSCPFSKRHPEIAQSRILKP
jgi:hypothetical protein